MKAKTYALAAAAALLLALPALCQNTVRATGTAALIGGDVAKARDRAIENALRTAVEQVIGTMVDSESLVKNNELLSDRIYTQTTGYIAGYTILDEKKDTDANLYSVTVEANVKEGNLTDDLNAVGILMRRMKMPRVAVALQEDGDAASAQVIRLLRDKGFLMVDTGEQQPAGFYGMSTDAQADLMKKYGAEVVVLGSARGSAGGSVGRSEMKSYQGSVNLKALKTDTREVLGTAQATGTAVHVGEAGLAQALRQAATAAGNDLIRQITAQWAKESSSARSLTLEVTGLDPAKAANMAEELVRKGRGIQDAVVRESSGGESVLSVSMQGDASALAQEIKRLYPRARITSQSANRLTVSF